MPLTREELVAYATEMLGPLPVEEKPYNPLETVDEQLLELDRVRDARSGLGYLPREVLQHLRAVAPGRTDLTAIVVEAAKAWQQ